MGVAKVVVDNITMIDMTDATAIASAISSGIIGYGADGNKIIGISQNGEVANAYVNSVLNASKISTLEWTLPENAALNLGWANGAANITVHGSKYVASTSPNSSITGIINIPDAIQIYGGSSGTWSAAAFNPTCVYCPNVITLGANFLIGANQKNIVKLVISANPYNASNSLRNSPYFKALVIKHSSVPTLSSSSALTNSGIGQNSDAYIYVPRILVNSYKADTNWSVFADKFRAIEDYPLIDAPDTWLPSN